MWLQRTPGVKTYIKLCLVWLSFSSRTLSSVWFWDYALFSVLCPVSCISCSRAWASAVFSAVSFQVTWSVFLISLEDSLQMSSLLEPPPLASVAKIAALSAQLLFFCSCYLLLLDCLPLFISVRFMRNQWVYLLLYL